MPTAREPGFSLTSRAGSLGGQTHFLRREYGTFRLFSVRAPPAIASRSIDGALDPTVQADEAVPSDGPAALQRR